MSKISVNIYMNCFHLHFKISPISHFLYQNLSSNESKWSSNFSLQTGLESCTTELFLLTKCAFLITLVKKYRRDWITRRLSKCHYHKRTICLLRWKKYDVLVLCSTVYLSKFPLQSCQGCRLVLFPSSLYIRC